MKNLVVLIFCAAPFLVEAGDPKEDPEWFQGAVVLADGLVLRGELAPQEMFDMVLFRDSNGLRVLPAHMFIEFRYYDPGANINRRFISVGNSGSREWNLYEVVLEGQIKVLRKLKRLHGKDKSDRHDYHYFVARDSHILSLRQFRNKVYPDLVRTNPDAVRGFQRENKLNPNQPADAILLIDYFNDLGSDRVLTRRDPR